MLHLHDSERLVIFSDTHLTPFFNPKQLALLEKIISRADKIIINGDFWDASYWTFDQFVKSKWAVLFPLLQNKKAIYVYGNHDLQELQDTRSTLFSTRQVQSIILSTGVGKLHIHHGHWLLKTTSSVIRLFKHHPRLLHFITLPFQLVNIIIRYIAQYHADKFSYINNGFRDYKRKHIPEADYLITGHSHVPQLDLAHKYINVGFIHSGFASWIEIKGKTIIQKTSLF